jgi:hypothetical protein
MDTNKHESNTEVKLLRLTVARSGARVCDPQRAVKFSRSLVFIRG